MENAIKTATTLIEALPFMQQYTNKIIVIKFGGHAMASSELTKDFARDVVLLKQCGICPIVVHGGGPQINKLLDELNIQSEFIDGQRKTDEATLDVAQMVLCGKINKGIVDAIHLQGGKAIGISGIDGKLLSVKKMQANPNIDLGWVGEPVKINQDFINYLVKSEYIPIIAPIASDDSGQHYNVNADIFAGFLAGEVGAERLLMLTDVAGILDKHKNLIEDLSLDDAIKITNDGTISGGMIPKVECCIQAINMGLKAAVVCDGRVAHVILLELFTAHGLGTLIHR